MLREPIDSEYIYGFLRYKSASDAERLALAQIAEHVVLEHRPNAKLLFGSDRQGNMVNVGIYDAPLSLNHLGQFRPLQQHAPQLLSKRIEVKGLVYQTLRVSILCDLWLDCLVRVANSEPVFQGELESASQAQNKW